MDFVHIELKRDTWIQPAMKVQTPDEAVDAVQKLIENLDREAVVCIYLATSGRVINAAVCSIGAMDQSVVSPTEIIRTALVTGAKSMILLHNHPSGQADPSKDDFLVTRRMACVGKLVGIKLLDHIVVGDRGMRYSMKENRADLFEIQKDMDFLMIAAERNVEDEK